MYTSFVEGLSIDRIDVNGPYSPENCRWATLVEQGRNKTNNTLIEYKGRILPVSQMLEEEGLTGDTAIEHRIYQHKMTLEEA